MAGKTAVVAGGTGFVGSALCDRLEELGWGVTVLTRVSRTGRGRRRFVTWAPEEPSSAAAVAAREMEKAAAVVNLAGESVVSGRWTEARKARILASRVDSTRAVVEALARTSERPPLLVNASAIGYYGPRGDEAVDESSEPGGDFLAGVCRRWEEEAAKAEGRGVRAVRLRIGLVLGAGGGALARMLTPFRLGLGGPLGSGTQWMSWVHIEDLVRMILWAAEGAVSGPVNATAPQPVTNEEFSRTLARALGRPCVFRVPGFALKLLAGELGGVLLTGQRVLPRKAQEGGFEFRFPALGPALNDILSPSPQPSPSGRGQGQGA